MRITRTAWGVLTLGEKLSILSYAAYETQKRWAKR